MLQRIAMRFEKKCGTISTLLQAARAQLAAMEEEAAEAEAERAAVEEEERQEEEDDTGQQQREGSGDEDESENDRDDEDAHEGATGTDIGGHAAEEDDSDSGGEASTSRTTMSRGIVLRGWAATQTGLSSRVIHHAYFSERAYDVSWPVSDQSGVIYHSAMVWSKKVGRIGEGAETAWGAWLRCRGSWRFKQGGGWAAAGLTAAAGVDSVGWLTAGTWGTRGEVPGPNRRLSAVATGETGRRIVVERLDWEGASNNVALGGPGGTDRRGEQDRGRWRGMAGRKGSLRGRVEEWAEKQAEPQGVQGSFKGGVNREFTCEGAGNGRQMRREFEGVQRRG
ncbi:hypothetical protein B0H17DRAFT_1138882 [Mycena rosella]|uniref:Uncharacterized protein n=1 Tax=Mycena rosella TaxID=1033263 RepID=A0AAD7GDV9_MYCRO|nr:hypothetical protein B0H17DRAFT_1138882 [Mycena rosella]